MAPQRFRLLHNERPAGTAPPAEGFDVLIKRAAALLIASAMSYTDDERAQCLQERAYNCMIEAARSPFFGGTKSTMSYAGLDAVRELVFELVHDELTTCGYPLPNRSALISSI